MLGKVVLAFNFVSETQELNANTMQGGLSPWIKSLSVTIQMKATEQYFAVVLFIMQVQRGSNS